MNIAHNMEAVFVAALGLACAAAYSFDAAPAAQPQVQAQRVQAVQVASLTPAGMQVIVVSARRMTEAEKLQSLEQERLEAEKLATIRSGFRGRI